MIVTKKQSGSVHRTRCVGRTSGGRCVRCKRKLVLNLLETHYTLRKNVCTTKKRFVYERDPRLALVRPHRATSCRRIWLMGDNRDAPLRLTHS